jgi:Spy/CpxP family protein refolding chaperone
MKTIYGLLIIGFLQSWSVFADDNSARRYAALYYDATTCKYFLLSTKEVQGNLKLTQQQIKSLQSAGSSSSLTNDPAIAEYRRSHKQLLAAAHSDEERAKIRREGNEKYSLLFEQNMKTTLQSTLSPPQTKRLDELFLQMKGPHAILEDTNVIQELNLSKEQISQMNDDFNSDGQLLSLLRQRFLRLQIQPMRKRDRADLDSEMKSLVRVIKEVEKDRDDGLLAVLNEEQRRSWNNLCGAPVSIDWKIDYFSDAPFQEEKTNSNHENH